jgi:hypothetical protein
VCVCVCVCVWVGVRMCIHALARMCVEREGGRARERV